MDEKSLYRFRVKVLFPPKPRHRGFVVWAETATAARRKVIEFGHIVRSVRREDMNV
jgi:hypothetical protein